MKIEKYINDLKSLPEPRRTFMEIMKTHKSEVHLANLLAFFFRSEEKHGLGKIFLEALFETGTYQINRNLDNTKKALIDQAWKIKDNGLVGFSSFKIEESKKDSYLDSTSIIQAISEEITKNTIEKADKKKRIDILLETDKCVVCIEFKIDHELNNPLEAYQNHISEKEKALKVETGIERDLFFVVLTPYKKESCNSIKKLILENRNCFREMILSHFVKNIIAKLPSNYLIDNFDNYHTQYLIDFIQTIRNREIRYKRGQILNDLKSHCIKNGFGFEYHNSGRKGGMLEFKQKDARFKIRIINNSEFKLEKWSIDNKFDLNTSPIVLPIKHGYEDFITSLKTFIKM
jgi:hypothetical protein